MMLYNRTLEWHYLNRIWCNILKHRNNYLHMIFIPKHQFKVFDFIYLCDKYLYSFCFWSLIFHQFVMYFSLFVNVQLPDNNIYFSSIMFKNRPPVFVTFLVTLRYVEINFDQYLQLTSSWFHGKAKKKCYPSI